MRIWVLSDEYEPLIIGGLGTVATRLSRTLAGLDIGVSVITRGIGNTRFTRDRSVHVLRVPKRMPFYFGARRRYNTEPILALTRRHQMRLPNVVHVHSVGMTNPALYLQQTYDIPVVYTCHSLLLDEPPSPSRTIMLERQERLLSKADRIVVPSEWQRREMIKVYPRCAKRIRVISNGVDLPETTPSVNVSESGESRKPVRLLFVGRLIPQKGIEELLESVSVLRRRGLPVTLDVVGRGGPAYQARLAEMARNLQIDSHVHWLGFQPAARMGTIYTNHDLVVVPSKMESFGLVALEAMACGIPLVSTQSGGLSDFVDSDVAQVISRVNHQAIAYGVERALRDPDDLMSRVMEGRSRAERYAWTSVAERYEELFRELRELRGNRENREYREGS